MSSERASGTSLTMGRTVVPPTSGSMSLDSDSTRPRTSHCTFLRLYSGYRVKSPVGRTLITLAAHGHFKGQQKSLYQVPRASCLVTLIAHTMSREGADVMIQLTYCSASMAECRNDMVYSSTQNIFLLDSSAPSPRAAHNRSYHGVRHAIYGP